MNLQKFTQKSLEAIQNAQSNAVEYGNPQLDQQHLLLALLQQEDDSGTAAEDEYQCQRLDAGSGE